VPITDTAAFAPLRFEFGVAMGVRKDEPALLKELNEIIERRREDIHALLDEFRRARGAMSWIEPPLLAFLDAALDADETHGAIDLRRPTASSSTSEFR
jgi:hypothetical protein